ncbi:MAG: hypothetical protein D6802_10010 [Ardenticatenia bacterium]|nr:MAG: hypothetical protein D6802_10010 [Ardenticatenia bacterium]
MEHLRLELHFTLDTAFHTTGNRRRWGADKALAMSPGGTYVIPATSLKGVLRDRAEALLRTWGHDVCAGPAPETMCSCTDHLCLVCQVFGNPRFSSPLRFQDAQCDPDVVSQIRSGVSISRQRRAALSGRLFFVETTAPGPLEAKASCEGYFPDRAGALQACALVALAARWTHAVGSGRTRGLGWIGELNVQATLNGAPVSRQEMEALWRVWSGGDNVAEN